MGVFLIEISFGPVQGFIAAARRSRDLWGGSHILSEIAREAGLSLLRNQASLVYPLENRVNRNDANDSNLSNVLLAQLNDTHAEAVQQVALTALKAGRDRLKKFSADALQEWRQVSGLRHDVWQAQIDDALESFAAWSEIVDNNYPDAYKRLKQAFAARKNTRDFLPSANIVSGIPKSSLDGLRESVFSTDRKLPVKFGVCQGEQLDALGAIKRFVGKRESFTALTRLAADPWLRTLKKDDLKKLREAYEPLVALELATRTRGNENIYNEFPFDASLLYVDRLNNEMGSVEDRDSLGNL